MTQTDEQTRAPARISVNVRKACEADVPALTAALARAFDDDPLINWMAAQDARRARRVYDSMEIALRKLSWRHNEVYTTDGVHGGALWAPPGKWKMGMLQQLMLVPAMSHVTTWKRMPRIMAGINAIEKKHPSRPHFYLFVLGTDTVHQGKGVGTQLLAPVLERCDREGTPAYLESSKEKNVPFYEHNGFKVTEKVDVPNGGPPIWLMWRDPR